MYDELTVDFEITFTVGQDESAKEIREMTADELQERLNEMKQTIKQEVVETFDDSEDIQVQLIHKDKGVTKCVSK